MNINKLQTVEDRNLSLEVRTLDGEIIASQMANMYAWHATDSEGFRSFIKVVKSHSALPKLSLVAALSHTHQINIISADSAERLHYYAIMMATEKLNYPQRAPRIEILQIDAQPISVADVAESETADKAELEVIFRGLAKNWQEATRSYSLNMRRYAHPTYQLLMHALGKENVRDVVPLILNELRQRPDVWFEALKVLTKANPAQDSKSFDEAVAAWIEWGKKENFIS